MSKSMQRPLRQQMSQEVEKLATTIMEQSCQGDTNRQFEQKMTWDEACGFAREELANRREEMARAPRTTACEGAPISGDPRLVEIDAKLEPLRRQNTEFRRRELEIDSLIGSEAKIERARKLAAGERVEVVDAVSLNQELSALQFERESVGLAIAELERSRKGVRQVISNEQREIRFAPFRKSHSESAGRILRGVEEIAEAVKGAITNRQQASNDGCALPDLEIPGFVHEMFLNNTSLIDHWKRRLRDLA